MDGHACENCRTTYLKCAESAPQLLPALCNLNKTIRVCNYSETFVKAREAFVYQRPEII